LSLVAVVLVGDAPVFVLQAQGAAQGVDGHRPALRTPAAYPVGQFVQGQGVAKDGLQQLVGAGCRLRFSVSAVQAGAIRVADDFGHGLSEG
jgi:hypothetical protein